MAEVGRLVAPFLSREKVVVEPQEDGYLVGELSSESRGALIDKNVSYAIVLSSIIHSGLEFSKCLTVPRVIMKNVDARIRFSAEI
jgi:hypothetical protein